MDKYPGLVPYYSKYVRNLTPDMFLKNTDSNQVILAHSSYSCLNLISLRNLISYINLNMVRLPASCLLSPRPVYVIWTWVICWSLFIGCSMYHIAWARFRNRYFWMLHTHKYTIDTIDTIYMIINMKDFKTLYCIRYLRN